MRWKSLSVWQVNVYFIPLRQASWFMLLKCVATIYVPQKVEGTCEWHCSIYFNLNNVMDYSNNASVLRKYKLPTQQFGACSVPKEETCRGNVVKDNGNKHKWGETSQLYASCAVVVWACNGDRLIHWRILHLLVYQLTNLQESLDYTYLPRKINTMYIIVWI